MIGLEFVYLFILRCEDGWLNCWFYYLMHKEITLKKCWTKLKYG